MYKNLGYNIYRTVNKYYSGSEKIAAMDAYGIFILLHFRYEEEYAERCYWRNFSGNWKDDRTR